jgi:tetratricopeptide (TPR) repeat protein
VLRRVGVALVLLLCAAFCVTQLAEVDLFWHLLAGRQILAEGRVPFVDSFTYTSAGRPWTDLHWMFQVAVALVHRAAGFAGLDGLKLALIVTGFGCALAAGLRRSRGLIVPLLGLLGVVAAQERFTLRPEAATFCLLGVLLLLISRRDVAPRGLWAAPPIIALWANLHSLYVVGIAVLLLVLTGDGVEWLLARRRQGAGAPTRFPRELAIATAAACGASLITPYGFATWALPRTLFLERIATSNLYGRTIAEFQAPLSGFGQTRAVGAFALLAGLALFGMAGSWRAHRIADRLLLMTFLALALLARRNIPLFALVVLPSGSAMLDLCLSRLSGRLSGFKETGAPLRRAAHVAAGTLLAAVAVLLLADLLSNRFYARDGTQRFLGWGVAAGFYPEAAADLVRTTPFQGEVLNDMTMGGYLAWRWYPGRRTFIDGRLEVHDPALYASYLELQGNPERFEAVAARYDIRAVLWSHRQALDAAPLLRHLAGGGRWRLAYVDLAAALFLRDDAAAAGNPGLPRIDLDADPPIERLLREADAVAARGRAGDPLPAWLRATLPRVEVPASEVGAALFFALIGRHAIALPLLQDTVRRAPWSAELRYDLGLVLSQSARNQEARASLEEALRLRPRWGAAHAALATLDLQAGDVEAALRGWRQAEMDGELPPAARQARGALLAGRGRLDEAISDYRGALKDVPGQAAWRAELGLLYAARGLPAQAHAEIDRALAIDRHACVPRVAASRLLREEGKGEAAEALLDAALAETPDCQEAVQERARIMTSSPSHAPTPPIPSRP